MTATEKPKFPYPTLDELLKASDLTERDVELPLLEMTVTVAGIAGGLLEPGGIGGAGLQADRPRPDHHR